MTDGSSASSGRTPAPAMPRSSGPTSTQERPATPPTAPPVGAPFAGPDGSNGANGSHGVAMQHGVVPQARSKGPSGPVRERPPLRDRVQAKLTAFRAEHRANANPVAAGSAPLAVAPARSTAPAPAPARKPGRRPPRRARLRVTRVDPWSVMKTAFLLAIAFGVVTVVAVLMVWSVLDAAGVWDSINATVQNAIGGEDTANFDVENYVGMSRIVGFTMLVAAIDVVLLTAIATLAAFLYNMAAALLGGIEVTLAEDNR